MANSVWAYPGADGRMLYAPRELGDHVEDFSAVGYKAGQAAIPDLPVKATVASPSGGDDTAIIQAAINAVQAMALDGNGFRGAVLLGPGTFRIDGSLNITASGVVLRGSGQNQTFLRASTLTSTAQRTVINVNGSGTRSTVSGTTHTITDKYVPVGAISFAVDSTANLHVGDQVIVHRPSTQQWINDMGMNLLDNPWTPGSKDVNMDRTITHIDGNVITIDAPIAQALDLKYTDAARGNNTIYKYTANGRLQNVGVEDLSGFSDYDPALKSGSDFVDENHPWIFINVDGSQNAWVRNVTSQFFAYSCVSVTGGSKYVTIQDSQCLDPVSQVTGGRRYSFNIDDSSHVLFRNLYTRGGRHDFVEGSTVTGPNVFVDSRADNTRADAGPHHRYSTLTLWDNVRAGQLNIQDRGNSGTGHGHAGANQVIWNSTATSSTGFIVQSPIAAQNWLIGSIGTTGNGGGVGFHTPGLIDSQGDNVTPRSLYYQQLGERTAYANSVLRELRLGDADSYLPGNPADAPAVDATWKSAIQSATAKTAVGFDTVAADQLVPFTFNLNLDVSTYVVGASLSLGLKSNGSLTSSDKIYVDNTGAWYTWAQLGVANPGAAPGAVVIDLSALLPTLQDGKLNLAIVGNTAIDWATLNYTTASVAQPTTTTLNPSADAYVQDGASAALNFGTATTVQTKLDTTNDNRESYLRFDLSSFTSGQAVTSAILKLYPTSVGYAATNHFGSGAGVIFNRISSVSFDTWSETGINWNNRPAAEPYFREFVSYPNEPVTIDVTALVRGALAGDKVMSLKLASIVNSSSGQINFASRENPDAALRPQLVIQSVNAPNTLIVSGDQDTPAQNDSIRLVRNGSLLDIYRNDPSTPAYHLDFATMPPLSINGLDGNDTVTIDWTGGLPIPAAGLTVDLGAGASDILSVIGSAANDAFSLAPGIVTNSGSSFSYSNAEELDLFANGGADSLSMSGTPTPAFKLATGNSGTLSLSAGTTLPGITDLLIPIGSTFNLSGLSQSIDSLDGGGILINNGSATVTLTLGSAGGSGLFSGNLNNGSAALSLTKEGSGTQTLAGPGSYTGATNVNDGVLRIAHPNALGATSSGTTISGGTATGRVELTGNISVAEPFSLANRTGSNGGNFAPHLLNLSGNNTLTGAITLNSGGSYWTLQSDAGLLTISSNLTNNVTSNTRTLFLRGAGAGLITGQIRQTNLSLTLLQKEDAGTWTLTGSNNHTGGTVVNAGALAISPVAIPPSTAVTVNNAASLRLAGANSTFRIGTLTLNSGGSLGVDLGGNRVVLNNLSMANTARFDLRDASFIYDYTGISPAATIRSLLSIGRTNGWTGAGLVSSSADPTHAIGYAEVSAIGLNSFANEPLDATAVVARLAPYGDSNLDARVDFDDFARTDRGHAKSLTWWTDGDYNYDSTITNADYALMNGTFVTSVIGPVLAGAESAVLPVVTALASPVALVPVKPSSITIKSPATTRRGRSTVFKFATPAALPRNSRMTYSIDWDGDGVTDQVLTGRSSLTVRHRFRTGGLFNVVVQIADQTVSAAIYVI